VIIEAIFENLEAKRSLFAQLEAAAKPGAILATNTSSLKLADIATALKDPSRLVGIHFFNPVPQLQLVEVVSAEKTNPELAKKAAAFVRQIDKLPLPVKDAPGFLVNRVLGPYMYNAFRMLDQGVKPETLDRAMEDFGMPMGPAELADTVGLDICLAAGKALAKKFSRMRPTCRRCSSTRSSSASWEERPTRDLSLRERQAGERPARRVRRGSRGGADPALSERGQGRRGRGHRRRRRPRRRRPHLRHRLRSIPGRAAALPGIADAVDGPAPENKLPALRVMTMPADANQNGDIFGGWIMSHVDIAGGILAGRTARGRVATVAVKEFIFKQPVQVGDVLSFYTDLVRIGNTSITVTVEVYAERRPSDPKVVKVTEATLTYVAIDRDGRPRPVPRS